MNTQKFIQTGGFPFELDNLNEMQKAYQIFNSLGWIAGDKTIIYGCTQNGNSIKDGYIFLDGELFPFKKSLIESTVVIRENRTPKTFENGEVKEVYFDRYITFGSGVGAIPWSDFQRIDPLREIQKSLVPKGAINMWSGAIHTIPNGWALCDGRNGTPNLSGKFIVGYNGSDSAYNAIGKTGGAEKVPLTTEELPSHSHNGTAEPAGYHTHGGSVRNGGNHSHGYRDSYFIESTTPRQDQSPNYGSERVGTGFSGSGDLDRDNTYMWYRNRITSSGGSHTHGLEIYRDGNHFHTLSIRPTGGNKAHENRPPYFTLAYIIKL